jgi:hypothetical protein
LTFFLVRLGAFLGKGSKSKKTPQTHFCKKSMSETFPQKNDQNFGVNFSSSSFDFIAFSGVSQRQEFKNTTESFLQKHRVEKFFYKKIKIIDTKPILCRFFYQVFGRFS